MIKNIIFDFGDVFINLDKTVVFKAMAEHGISELSDDLDAVNKSYETGGISSEEFLNALQSNFQEVPRAKIKTIWNSMLLDFPEYRLDFLEELAKEGNYRLFLLSNTNALHIPYVAKIMGVTNFYRFKNCFEGFYLSHEIGLRKPNKEIFEFVLHKHKLEANETLFIDDTEENTNTAKELKIHTWHLKVGSEDIIDLKSKL